MRRILLFLLLLILTGVAAPALAQTSVTAYVPLDLTSPVAPGTQLTSTIWTNGTGGSALSGWGSSGAAANMTVGSHNPLCPLLNQIKVGSTVYSPGQPSLPFSMVMSTNNTYWDANYTSSIGKIVASFCLSIPTSLNGGPADIVNFQDATQFSAWTQINSSSDSQAPCGLDLEVSPSPITNKLLTTCGNTYWVTVLVDEVNGIGCIAAYQPTYPYTQIGFVAGTGGSGRSTGVGGSQCIPTGTSSHFTAVRIGNAEAGTSSSTMKIEGLILDSVNATFPLIPTVSNPWAGVLSPLRAIDWTRGGAPSINEIRTQCVTAACNTVVSNGQSSTLAQVNAAIASAPAHSYVRLPTGSYNFASMVDFTGTNNVTLRGDGAAKTIVAFSGTGGCAGISTTVCMSNGNDNNHPTGPDNTANVTSGMLAGTTTVTLSSVTNLHANSILIFDQLDDDQTTNCDQGGILVAQNTTTCAGATSPGLTGPYSLENYQGQSVRNNRGQNQIVTVTAINGTSVTFSPGLYSSNWRSSQSPQAWWATTPTTGLGLEYLTIDDTNAGAAGGANPGILIKNAADSWVKGCRIANTDRSHVMMYISDRITVRDNYDFGTQNSATISYGTEFFNCSDCMNENNIYHAVTGPVKYNGPAPGAINDYNFAINGFYTPSAGWNQPNFSWHAEGTQYDLNEGNIFNITDADNFHGTHNFGTLFRSYISGWQPACYASGSSYATATYGTCNNNLNAVSLLSFARNFNIIGNVLGHTGTYTTYSANTQTDHVVYVIGAGATESFTIPTDANVSTLLMRWGNYDTVNAATRFVSSEVPSTALTALSQSPYTNGLPPTQTLPPSFIYCTSPLLASCTKPSWWNSEPWPAVGPDVTGGTVFLGNGASPGSGGAWTAQSVGGHANNNPAEDCYKNIMNGLSDGTGPMLTFDAATCYAQAATPSPSGISGSGSISGTAVIHN